MPPARIQFGLRLGREPQLEPSFGGRKGGDDAVAAAASRTFRPSDRNQFRENATSAVPVGPRGTRLGSVGPRHDGCPA